MMKTRNVFDKYRKFGNPKISCILKKYYNHV